MDKKGGHKKTALEQHPGPNGDNPQAWMKFYALAEHWQLDMKFFGDELNFLDILVDKYFLRLTKEEESLSKIKPVITTLSRIEARRRALDQKIAKYLHHLQQLMENTFPGDVHPFDDEHAALESVIADFVKDLRATKTEIFSLTEQVLKSEKAKHLLGP